MTEITDANLFKLFAGEQSIDKMRLFREDIHFCEYMFDPDTEQIEPRHRSIVRSDFKDIKRVFTSMRSCPTTEYLILILWIREVKFKMDSLPDADKLGFVKKAFDLNGINIDIDVVWEFQELFSNEYIYEEVYCTEEITGDDSVKHYFLTSKGKEVAEKMFESMKQLANAPVESPPIVQPTKNIMGQIAVESDGQILDMADANAATKKMIAALHKGEKRIDHNAIIRELLEKYPEAKAFDSSRLLLYYQGFARKYGIEIDITPGRIRQLPVWKENEVHRMSGKTQYREEMGDAPDVNAEDVNDVDYEKADS